MLVEPLHQRAAGVQRDLQRVKRLEDLQERQVAVLVRLLENVVKVADRLVVVQGQAESDWIGHCCERSRRGTVRNKRSGTRLIAHAQKVIGTVLLA